MELKLDDTILFLGEKWVELTDEQLKRLGVKTSPFDMKDGDKYYTSFPKK